MDVRDGNHLATGKPFKLLGNMRSREVLGNWLLCAVANANEGKDTHTFTSDPVGGDGVIINMATTSSWPTEHVMVGKPHTPSESTLPIESRIIQAFNKKLNKGGEAYARGKQLIIFLDAAGGEWKPRRVAQQLPNPLVFADVWVVGLQPLEDGKYVYGVSQLGTPTRDAPTWIVRIDSDFRSWVVEALQ
ncbi:MAG: hypothetical protein ACKO0Z_26445 [Betaproteobacteria bacterium]